MTIADEQAQVHLWRGRPPRAVSCALRKPRSRAVKIIRANTIELVYVALDASRAPAFGQSGMHRIPVASQVAAESTQFGWTARRVTALSVAYGSGEVRVLHIALPIAPQDGDAEEVKEWDAAIDQQADARCDKRHQ
jgi:hypothetical protein